MNGERMDAKDSKIKVLVIDLDTESSLGFKAVFKDIPDTEVEFETTNFQKGLEKIEGIEASIDR